jgi:hypothetical protein
MIAQTSVEIIDEKAKKKRGAKIKVQLFSGFKEAAERYEAVGDWTRAAEARRRVFEQAQTLRKLGNTNNFARLAAARGRLDTTLSRVGKITSALRHGLETEHGFRQLAERQPDAYRGEWARSLDNLASRLSDPGALRGGHREGAGGRADLARAGGTPARRLSRGLGVGARGLCRV